MAVILGFSETKIEWLRLRFTRARRLGSSCFFSDVPEQLEVANSSFVKWRANIFRAALCLSVLVSSKWETFDRVEGVKTFKDCNSDDVLGVLGVLVGVHLRFLLPYNCDTIREINN